jgi:hypothetical protein
MGTSEKIFASSHGGRGLGGPLDPPLTGPNINSPLVLFSLAFKLDPKISTQKESAVVLVAFLAPVIPYSLPNETDVVVCSEVHTPRSLVDF